MINFWQIGRVYACRHMPTMATKSKMLMSAYADNGTKIASLELILSIQTEKGKGQFIVVRLLYLNNFFVHASLSDTGNESEEDTDEETGYDSDVEREKNIDYTTKIYTHPIRTQATSGNVVKPQEQSTQIETK